MKVAILGGGFTGLTASYYLAEKGHAVTLFEKEDVLGGLAAGFKRKNWDWSLEKAVHHLFTNDHDIRNFAKEVRFKGIFFKAPTTASLYEDTRNKLQEANSKKQTRRHNYRKIPVDTPQDFLFFPLLSLTVKLRAALVLAFLKTSPFLSMYEKQTAEEFLKKSMGEQAWEVLWRELFRKKFGKYAGKILASFIWARIKKRTKKLGYIKGGFQRFISHTEEVVIRKGVVVRKNHLIRTIRSRHKNFEIAVLDISKNQEREFSFDVIISTLPTPILRSIGKNVLPADYQEKLSKIEYQHAISLVVETKKPFFEKIYWANVCVPDNPIMGIFEHTNFMDPKHYGGNHLLYVGNYVDESDPRLRMTHDELVSYYVPHLKKINPKFQAPRSKFYSFKGPFAQPIFDKGFLKSKPDFKTPVENFYIANLDMTYPYDRGTNYAVALGKKVSELIPPPSPKKKLS